MCIRIAKIMALTFKDSIGSDKKHVRKKSGQIRHYAELMTLKDSFGLSLSIKVNIVKASLENPEESRGQ
jgi:hypothetical protein